MTEIIFSSIKSDLKTAIETPGHPFRYFTLATSDINGVPKLRTVVLRNVDNDLNLLVYTDRRSKKITHITDKNRVGLLFYDATRLLQISIRAKAIIIKDDKMLNEIWNHIPNKSKKDYTTRQLPGIEISSPEEVDYLEEKHFLTAIKLVPEKIEYLRLKRPNHIRILYKKEQSKWVGGFIAP